MNDSSFLLVFIIIYILNFMAVNGIFKEVYEEEIKYIKRNSVKAFKIIIPINWRFEFEYRIVKLNIHKSSHWLAYPVLVHLTFNKSWYKYWFGKGRSVKDSVIKHMEIMGSSMMRHLAKKPSQEANIRLERFKDYKENKNEILTHFGVKSIEDIKI